MAQTARHFIQGKKSAPHDSSPGERLSAETAGAGIVKRQAVQRAHGQEE